MTERSTVANTDNMTVAHILSRPCQTNLGNSTVNHRKFVITGLATDWAFILTREVTSNYEISLLGNTHVLRFNKFIHLTNNLTHDQYYAQEQQFTTTTKGSKTDY